MPAPARNIVICPALSFGQGRGGEAKDFRLRALWRTPILGNLVFSLWMTDARRKARWIAPSLRDGDRLLEIGSGPGSLIRALKSEGRAVIPVDIEDSAFSEELRPILFDGRRLPFPDDSFDVSLLLTTLHHADDPDALIREAMRVAPRLIIIEDVYRSALQRRLTLIADSLTNLSFAHHPHNNRDDDGWRATFSSLGLRLLRADFKPYVGAFLQVLYELERA